MSQENPEYIQPELDLTERPAELPKPERDQAVHEEENKKTPRFEVDDDPGAYHKMQWKSSRRKRR